MRVCDWIAEYLYSVGIKNVHGLMGGGASGLNDGFIKNGKINYVCYHHEQSAGHSAIGESKFTGKLEVVNPTTGCAGTNCATSVLNAWQDSVPILFLSGNVRLSTCSNFINRTKNVNIRKYGIQEHNIVETYSSITKFSYFIDSVDDVAYTIQYAVHIAQCDRPGPVWIDIPGDIQTSIMPEKYRTYEPTINSKLSSDVSKIKKAIETFYGVNVAEVRTIVVPSKAKSRFTKAGVVSGRKPAYKKAYITVAEGENIDLYANV